MEKLIHENADLREVWKRMGRAWEGMGEDTEGTPSNGKKNSLDICKRLQ